MSKEEQRQARVPTSLSIEVEPRSDVNTGRGQTNLVHPPVNKQFCERYGRLDYSLGGGQTHIRRKYFKVNRRTNYDAVSGGVGDGTELLSCGDCVVEWETKRGNRCGV